MITEDLNYEAWAIRHWAWISEEISELKQTRLEFLDQTNYGQMMPSKCENKLVLSKP